MKTISKVLKILKFISINIIGSLELYFLKSIIDTLISIHSTTLRLGWALMSARVIHVIHTCAMNMRACYLTDSLGIFVS